MNVVRKLTGVSLVLLILAAGPLEAGAARIAVLPFVIHSQEDLGYLVEGIQDMMATQLQQRGAAVSALAEVAKVMAGKRPAAIDEQRARELGRTLGVDYVMFGSLTKVGRSISLDARLVDVKGLGKTASFSVQEEGLDNLAAGVEKIAREIESGQTGAERVARVLIEGNKRIEADAIKRVIQTQPGDSFSETKLSEDLKRVFGMNFFDDVKVDVDDSPEGKIVKFIVDEKPAIAQVDFSGNRMLESETLMGALGYSLYAIMDPQRMADSIENLKKLYREKGYYKAQITYESEPVGPKTVAVKYKVEEGSRMYVDRIDFLGNEAFSDRKLRKQMQTSTKNFLSWLTDSGILNQEVLKEDVTRLMAWYLNNGYLRARVGEPQVNVEGDDLVITISVMEGPQYKVGKVGVTGDLIAPEETLLSKIKINRQKIYIGEVVRKDVLALRDFYADHGYAYNDINPKLTEHEDTKTVDIVYAIEKKKQVTFERIVIAGNDKTKDKVIRRELKVVEGDLFSATNMRQSKTNLLRLGYFDDVQMTTSDGSVDNTMNLKIDVKERPTGAFSIGAGYSSYNQVFGTIRVNQNNLFGTGRRLSLEASLGGRYDEYMLSYTDPWLFDIPLTAGFDVFYTKDKWDLFTKNTSGFALRAGYPVFEEFRLSGRYLYQNVEITDIDAYAASVIKALMGKATSSGIGVQLRRDTRNRMFNTTEGSDNSINVGYTGGPLGGDLHYSEYVLDSGWFIPTFLEDVTLFVRGKIGYMVENKKDGLPVYQKFYLGGLNSVRGYKVWSISPTDPATGDTVGGEKMAQFNVELIFPLIKESGLMGVVFFDQGNVWRESEDYDFGDMRRSYGAGIRYYSPLGPLRLEYGRVINPRKTDPEGQWEFSVGTFF
ncbi:MAG: outer membrane protein assembly factor BamA [Thermodesulfobacteriota bacterium]